MLSTKCKGVLNTAKRSKSIDSFTLIHSGYFCSASSIQLLFRGAPDYSTDTVSELARRSTKATVSEGLAQCAYVAVEWDLNLRPFGRKALNLPLSTLTRLINVGVH